MGIEKAFGKFQHVFVVLKKYFSKLEVERILMSTKTFIVILSHERLNAFSLRLETRQGCLLLSFLFNVLPEVLTRKIRKGKKN